MVSPKKSTHARQQQHHPFKTPKRRRPALSSNEMRLEGQIQIKRGGGIHGLTVELLDAKGEYQQPFGETLTTAEGNFEFHFSREKNPEVFRAQPQAVLRVRDRAGQIVLTQKATLPFRRADGGIRIKLDEKTLREHLARPTSWQRQRGPLISKERLSEIDAAISLLIPPGEPGHNRLLRAARCVMPDLTPFETLLEDSFDVLEGDIAALDRFTTNLQLLEKSSPPGEEPNLDRVLEPRRFGFESEEMALLKRWHTRVSELNAKLASAPRERIIPEDRLTPVLLAAAYAGTREPGGAYRYLGILNDQLCPIGPLDTLWDAARGALGGNPRELKYFGGLLDQVGLECGPDDGPLPPFPEPHPRPRPKPCPLPWPPIDPPTIPLLPDRWDTERYVCMLDALLKFGPRLINPYRVTSITPITACAGQTIVIRGSNFGTTLQDVTFPTRSGFVNVQADTWSDTQINVKVPPGAVCGNLRLNIPEGTLEVCGRYIDVWRAGSGSPYFDGAEAEIQSFTANGQMGSQIKPVRVDPNAAVTFAWKVCPTTTASVNLQVSADGTVLFSLPSAQPVGTTTFTVPNFAQTKTIECVLTATSPCSSAPVMQRLYLQVHRLPDLTIDGIEVTQGLQYYHAAQHLTDPNDRGADNSLQLVESKPAYVRVYVRSGQDPNFNNGQVLGVTASLDVYRITGGVSSYVTTLQPVNPGGTITAEANPAYATERGTLNASLNFIIPASEMRGRINLLVGLDPFRAIQESNRNNNFGSVTVDVSLRQTLQVAGIMIAYTGPNAANTANLNLAAPTQAQLQQTLAFSMQAYPVRNTLQTRIAATLTQSQSLQDSPTPTSGCSPNWDALWTACVNARSNDGNQAGWVYCGILPSGTPIGPVLGCGGSGVAIFTNGAGTTAASENGHALGLLPLSGGGLGHAPVGGVQSDTDPNYPAYEPYDAANTPGGRIGEYGLNVNTGTVMSPANFFDIMSPTIQANMWVSLYTFGLLVNNTTLNPVARPVGATSGGGGAMIKAFPDAPEPIIDLIGAIDESDKITLRSVAHVTAYPQSPAGARTDLFAELVDRDGRVLSGSWVYAPLMSGNKDKEYIEPPYTFVASLRDVKGGTAIVFSRRGKEIYRHTAPPRKPVLKNFRAQLVKGGMRAKLSWELDHAAQKEPDVWVQASSDRGKTWRGVTVGMRGISEVDLSGLPGGNTILRLLAHDGFYTATAMARVVLPSRAPEAAILYPQDGAQIPEGAPLRLWGSGTSPQEGPLTGKALVWSSDRQGELGSGEELWIKDLRPGRHRLRLQVIDSKGQTSQARVTITVQDPRRVRIRAG